MIMRNVAIVVGITWLIALDASFNNGAWFAATSSEIVDILRGIVHSIPI